MAGPDLSELSRASRRASLISLAGFLVILGSLGYSGIKLADTQEEVARKQIEIVDLDAIIKRRQLENQQLFVEREKLLREFGWNEERLAQLGDGDVQIEQVVDASKARREVAIADRPAVRDRIIFEYFAKDVDPEKVVIQSLEELGFRVTKRAPRNPRQSTPAAGSRSWQAWDRERTHQFSSAAGSGQSTFP